MSTVSRDLLASFRCLFSYWIVKNKDLAAVLTRYFPTYRPPLFLDSGAFTAMTQGVQISVRDYGAWLAKYHSLFEVYANLDVIKNPTQTWEHQQRLEGDYGLAPLPVFHTATPFSWLERYLSRYSYIALGGLVGHNWTRYMGWLVQCFKLAQGRAVFHGFGVTSWEPWRDFAWASVDSSTWGQGHRYGWLMLFLAESGRFKIIHVKDREAIYRHAGHFRALGFDPAGFLRRNRPSVAHLATLNAVAYLQALSYIRQRHGSVMRLYLADASVDNFRKAIAGLLQLPAAPVEVLA